MSRWSSLFGMNRRNVELVHARNPRRYYPLVDDKIVAKERLVAVGVPVPATLAVCEGLRDLPALLEGLADQESFVIKPSLGGGGHGILVVGERVEPGCWRKAGGEILDLEALHEHAANILFGAFSRGAMTDRILVEPRVTPGGVYAEMWGDGLSDLRVITLERQPVMAMVRVPTASSEGRANLHQGGLGLAVDLETGRVTRAVRNGRLISRHPDNGAQLEGICLPAWQETLDVARRAAGSVPLGYLGVDIVHDKDLGPLVLELNARPGLEIQNVHGRGLASFLEAL
ncbi:MAG: hypothetical protein EP330_10080 [Deltaproteobacteria bacterium]|nr:MAG: hypothetical protein EP330_10080 [Deltaproteobacteria bacterium]